MSMIKVEDLTFSYPGSFDDVFEDCSFQIDTDWKLGFVGRNGKGKTTFLRLLMGEYEYSGKIISSVPFQYFPYPVEDAGQDTLEVLGGICPAAQEWEFLREFSYLELPPELLWRPFGTLSGGEQTKALLAGLFLNEGSFLLIDEPTNHLDTEGRELLAGYLKRKKGFILVSHDRRFLDGCTDHILSLNRATIDVRSGNFSSWMADFERQQSSERARNEKLKKDIRSLEQAARRASGWSDRTEAGKYGNGPVDRGYVGHKAAKLMKRSKAIEARRNQAAEEKAGLLKDEETAERLKICPLVHHKEVLLSVSEAAVCYGGRAVSEPVSFEVRQGERILLDGRNGSGKSSLLKLLAGEALDHRGTVVRASGLTISYVPQDTSFLKGSLTDLAGEYGIDETLFRAVLRKLDLERTQFEKPMEEYSGGQKKKVLIAKSLCEKAHLYLWDEPLNFIDIYSRMQIERLLQEFPFTMIFVEHDRAFQDLIPSKRIHIKGLGQQRGHSLPSQQ